MELKRKIRLHTFFIRYAVWVMIGAAVILAAALLLFSAGIETGWILPANYAEGMLTGRARQIQSAERVTEDLIPDTCRYGVYDREGTYLYGTFEKEEREDAWEIYREGERGKEGYYFRSFYREREVCIVKYRMVSSYTNKFLQQYFPAADWTLIGVTIILFFLYLIWLAKRFGRIISREISSLEQVTENISQQELNFERKSSKVLEIDAVLQSMDQMREALRQSLHRQWNMEQVRREQMAALAHDIKTPLTILRGNAELTLEAEELAEVKEYAEEIREETKTIENYLQVLQEMLLLERNQTTAKTKTKTDLLRFAEKIKKQADTLAKTRQMTVSVREIPENCLENFVLDMEEESIYRAWMNIIANSVEYGKEGGRIRLTVCIEEEQTIFVTEDDGPGFSEEELFRGTEQFYRGDKSRGQRNHYGMGLAIASRFVEQQGGRLCLGNSDAMGGAQVTITIPTKSGR